MVIAAINGDTFVKRLIQNGPQIVLQSENPTFAPRYILEGDELLIWGVEPALMCIVPMSLLLIWRHEGNIRKLLAGTESKIGQKAAPAAPAHDKHAHSHSHGHGHGHSHAKPHAQTHRKGHK